VAQTAARSYFNTSSFNTSSALGVNFRSCRRQCASRVGLCIRDSPVRCQTVPGQWPPNRRPAKEAKVASSQRNRVMTACGAEPGSAKDYPFGEDVAVFKVRGQMCALVSLAPASGSVSLKCDLGLAAGLGLVAWSAQAHIRRRRPAPGPAVRPQAAVSRIPMALDPSDHRCHAATSGAGTRLTKQPLRPCDQEGEPKRPVEPRPTAVQSAAVQRQKTTAG
jgi:hypothetical protein